MRLFSSNIKKILIFSQKKIFLTFPEMEPYTSFPSCKNNIFFYTQKGFVFYFLRNLCNVHDHIAAFLLFLFRKDFDTFHELFLDFCSLYIFLYDI